MRTTRTSTGPGGGPQRAHERFARAVDGGVRPNADPDLAPDLAVVAALRHAATAVGPGDAARTRIRSRVLAGYPAALPAPAPDAADPADPGPVVPITRRRSAAAELRGRLVVAAAAGLCLLMSLSGMSVLLARDAVPGDALYGFKRSAESAELGLTFGGESRALKHLQFATARLDEIEVMAAESDAADTWGQGAPAVVRTLDDFDSDAVAGTRLLTGIASNGRVGTLDLLAAWAEQQELRLAALDGALPLQASTRTGSTLALLDRVRTRAADLGGRADCRTVTSGAVDDLGAVPARTECVPNPEGAAVEVPLPGQQQGPDVSSPPAPVPGRPGQQPVVPAPGAPAPLPEPVPGGDPLLPLPRPPGQSTPPSEDGPPPIVLPLPLPLPDITLPPIAPGVEVN